MKAIGVALDGLSTASGYCCPWRPFDRITESLGYMRRRQAGKQNKR